MFLTRRSKSRWMACWTWIASIESPPSSTKSSSMPIGWIPRVFSHNSASAFSTAVSGARYAVCGNHGPRPPPATFRGPRRVVATLDGRAHRQHVGRRVAPREDAAEHVEPPFDGDARPVGLLERAGGGGALARVRPHLEHDLADVLRARHALEALVGTRERHHVGRQRAELAAREPIEQRVEHGQQHRMPRVDDLAQVKNAENVRLRRNGARLSGVSASRSRLPISMKRPSGRSRPRLAGMNSPAREFRTTSTPCPPVASRMPSTKLSERESKTCSMPSECRYSRLSG